MFPKLLILFLFTLCSKSFAQVGITPVKSSANTPVQPIDYTHMGTPMPAMRLLRCIDTNHAKHIITNNSSQDTASAKRLKSRKHKQLPEPVKPAVEAPAGIQQFVTNKDLDNGANLLVMLFNPTCSHCEDETRLLEKNMDLFKNTKLVLMASPTAWDYMPNFFRTYNIATYPSIILGIDSGDFVSKVYLYSALPQINIYDAQRKLIKTFAGEVSIDSLKQYIQ